MTERARGSITVPQIFIGPTHVGGCDELYALDDAGKLDPLLASRTRTVMSTAPNAAFRSASSGCVRATTARQSRNSARDHEEGAAGADYVQTPEMTNIMEARREALMAAIVPEDEDPIACGFPRSGAPAPAVLHIGSLALRISPGPRRQPRLADRSAREIAARYDKIHMFDVDLGDGESYRESRSYTAGEHAVVADLPWGRLGVTVCYDLRFPALYRALAEAGSVFLAIPSAFTRQTGEAHWHVLNRARAIENGAFVFAAAQGGSHENGRETFGHSMVVDPWGRILAEGEAEPGVVMADVDPAQVAAARANAFPRSSMAAASRSSSRWQSRRIFARCETHDPLRAQCDKGTSSKAGSPIRPPMTRRRSARLWHARSAAPPG